MKLSDLQQLSLMNEDKLKREKLIINSLVSSNCGNKG